MSDTSLIDRTLGNLRSLRSAWRDITASTKGRVEARLFGRGGPDSWRAQMQACLEGRGGEVSARARAAELGRTYLALDAAGRREFLLLLARDFDVDREEVDKAVDRFHDAGDPVARQSAERALRQALQAGRLKLLTQFNGLPEGVKFLVDMRAELLPLVRDDPLFAALDADLKELLKSWFDVGFLDLRRITWDSPAALLEKLIRYEAVHAIKGWDDLKNRLDSDRRCFAFFHPRMPDEPLIFVEVALVQGISGSIHDLLDQSAPVIDPRDADTAIFYSISNAQQGLVGISFGNFLIKRVVDELSAEFPNVRTFATLSPIPGLCAWLDEQLDARGDEILTRGEVEGLRGLLLGGEAGLLRSALARPDWHQDPELAEALKGPLLRLAAVYLLTARSGGRARDGVAHFHLSNGARVERLNWMADRSAKGLRQSATLMVNYAYRLSSIDANHEAYRGEGTVTASSAIKSLLKPGA
jgi:malonyl-CoA decarboxylase